jgi:hypothetical protein
VPTARTVKPNASRRRPAAAARRRWRTGRGSETAGREAGAPVRIRKLALSNPNHSLPRQAGAIVWTELDAARRAGSQPVTAEPVVRAVGSQTMTDSLLRLLI